MDIRSGMDKVRYYIPLGLVRDTEQILREAGALETPNEGFAYWGGHTENNCVEVQLLFVPTSATEEFRVMTTHQANSRFVSALSRQGLKQIAQVHSHPSDWVDHSLGDSAWAAFKVKGLLSIVVPHYGLEGMLPLTRCGIHRFDGMEFPRLSRMYIQEYFNITDSEEYTVEDLRNETD